MILQSTIQSDENLWSNSLFINIYQLFSFIQMNILVYKIEETAE